MSRLMLDWDALAGVIAGEVISPGAEGYESARRSAVALPHEPRPQAVVRCAAPDDVAETIAFTRRTGLALAVRSGGHCFAGRSSTSGIVIDVSPMDEVVVSGGTATVGAGTRLGRLYDTLADEGVIIPAGCGPSVGVADLALGGGLGILGRKYGLTSDRLVDITVVLADGRVVTCDPHHDDDLFWALRGSGGGQFGVVTSLTFATVAAGAATAFHLLWPHVHAAAVIEAWQRWLPTAPDEISASLIFTSGTSADRPPVVMVFGAMLGTEAETAQLLGELVGRTGADPTSTSYRQRSYRDVKQYLHEFDPAHDGGPVTSGTTFSKSEYFARPWPSDTIAALVDHLVHGRSPGEARELDFMPWGGAYNRVPRHATAFAHRAELFLLKYSATVRPHATSGAQRVARQWVRESWAIAHPSGTGGVYPNFPDPDLDDWRRAYHGTNFGRLVRCKGRYDPDNVFSYHQSIPAG